MSRPHCPRRIGWLPRTPFFYPGTLKNPEEVVLTLDELEALRLVDFEGLYQEEAARKMGVSRPTLGRILESAHRKAAEALVLGKILRIKGGTVYSGEVPPCPPRRCRCRCRHGWRGTPGDGPEEPKDQ
jgi:predicted DNA-binding protein (UPF0251 family)